MRRFPFTSQSRHYCAPLMPICYIKSSMGTGWGVSRLTIDSRIDRRHALLGLLASAGALAMPKAASALGVATPEKVYAGFFLGQGGYWFSWGMPYLASQAQELGMETDIYEYTQVKEEIGQVQEKQGPLTERIGEVQEENASGGWLALAIHPAFAPDQSGNDKKCS